MFGLVPKHWKLVSVEKQKLLQTMCTDAIAFRNSLCNAVVNNDAEAYWQNVAESLRIVLVNPVWNMELSDEYKSWKDVTKVRDWLGKRQNDLGTHLLNGV